MTEPKRKRGRPRKIKEKPKSWADYPGVSFVARKQDHPRALTHRWIAVKDNQVIGYYKTPEEARDAYDTSG